MLIIRNYILMN